MTNAKRSATRQKRTKVFCIGFHKTGTKSVAAALEKLGFRVTGSFGTRDPMIKQKALKMAGAIVQRFDAFQDNPWPILYRELDLICPESKFVLTIRSEVSWLKSQVRYFGSKSTPMREWIYGFGAPSGNEQAYLERYRQHNLDVIAYFSLRANDLLVFDLTKGDGWPKLCNFLDCSVPNEPFPFLNKTFP